MSSFLGAWDLTVHRPSGEFPKLSVDADWFDGGHQQSASENNWGLAFWVKLADRRRIARRAEGNGWGGFWASGLDLVSGHRRHVLVLVYWSGVLAGGSKSV